MLFTSSFRHRIRSVGASSVLLVAGALASAPNARAQAPPQAAAAAADTVPAVDLAPGSVAAVAPPPPPTAEAAPVRVRASLDGGFGVESADGAYGVQIGALIQYRFRAEERADHDLHPNFNTYNVRPQIRMHAFHDQLRLFIQPEFAGESARLLDLEMTYQPREYLRLRVGQFLTPFSRAYLTPIPVMQFANFGPANDVFRMNRDTGAMVFGTPFHGKLEYDLGVFNGNAIDRPQTDPVHFMGVARLQVAPLGAVPYDQTTQIRASQPWRFAVGVNGYMGSLQNTRHTTDPVTAQNVTVTDPQQDFRAGGADFMVSGSHLYVQGEGYVRRNHQLVAGGLPAVNATLLGAQLQAGWYIPQIKLELAARASYVDLNSSVRGTSISSIEGGLHYYIAGNHVKLRLMYQHAYAQLNVAASSGYIHGHQDRIILDSQVFF